VTRIVFTLTPVAYLFDNYLIHYYIVLRVGYTDLMTHVTATELGELLHRAAGSFARRGLAGFAEHGLSPARVRLVVAVGEAPGIRMRDLAEQLGVSARAVTPLVDRLEGEGLMFRKPDPADRRAIRLRLTETGERLRSVISELQERVSDDIFSALNQPERDHLGRLLRKLVTS
jgi:DNA-binding MarR family transcriptional regulator